MSENLESIYNQMSTGTFGIDESDPDPAVEVLQACLHKKNRETNGLKPRSKLNTSDIDLTPEQKPFIKWIMKAAYEIGYYDLMEVFSKRVLKAYPKLRPLIDALYNRNFKIKRNRIDWIEEKMQNTAAYKTRSFMSHDLRERRLEENTKKRQLLNYQKDQEEDNYYDAI